mmetsp:Transcript_33733/g.64533  ORF Transcript_33733/g.64533 Transcript_33733/m.64533 type:complete len:210 (-) Transcript_33733:195-824(-)
MGNAFRKLRDWLCAPSTFPARVVMLGLDNSGKTTILMLLKDSSAGFPRTVPTLGFNVECFRHQNVDLTVWDVGGQNQLRPLWQHYLKNSEALIFVVDAHDRHRMQEAASEFQTIVNNPIIAHCPVLVFANKQDLPESMAPIEVCRVLKLQTDEFHDRRWRVQGTVGTEGLGLHQGLDWLVSAISSSPQHKSCTITSPADAAPAQSTTAG